MTLRLSRQWITVTRICRVIFRAYKVTALSRVFAVRSFGLTDVMFKQTGIGFVGDLRRSEQFVNVADSGSK
jgi:hypothetical protein